MTLLTKHGKASEERMKTLEAELLNSLYTSKVTRERPQWKVLLRNVCFLLDTLKSQLAHEWRVGGEEEAITGSQFSSPQEDLDLNIILAVFQLQSVCNSGAIRQWKYGFLDQGNSDYKEEDPVKRKSPYIFKRQIHMSTFRRPYILKRNSFY
nr:PREDICTED: neurotensin/neuromedin N [Latimeria chalumnae]|eukprot:XP_006014046.1 PREDICTED: neurotensin/neuromedin N [Latimeria chalumnae]